MENLLQFASPYQAKGKVTDPSMWLRVILGGMVVVGAMHFGEIFWGKVKRVVTKARAPFRVAEEEDGPSVRTHF